MSETFTLQVKKVPVELRWKLRQAAANVGQGIGAFVIGVLEEVLDGKRGSSRSASTRDGELPVAYVSRASPANASIGAKIHHGSGNPAQEPASTQSGTERSSGSGGKRAADPAEGESPTYRARRTRVSVAAPVAADEAKAEPEIRGGGSRETLTTAPEKSAKRKSEPVATTTSERLRQMRQDVSEG